MKPTIGRQVLYRSRTGDYTLTATITATVDTLWPEGVERGDVGALSSDQHVHLHVLTPGAQEAFPEYDVPFTDLGVVEVPEGDPGSSMPARTWAWPPRVTT